MLAVVEVFAAGQTNQESVQLLIDSTAVATWSNIGGNALGSQFVRFAHTSIGTLSPDRVRVAFTNDAYDPASGIDRNVRIDAIAIDRVRFETESPNVYSTGTWRPEDGITPGFRQSEYLHSNGYFQFATPFGGTGSLVEVRHVAIKVASAVKCEWMVRQCWFSMQPHRSQVIRFAQQRLSHRIKFRSFSRMMRTIQPTVSTET